MEKMTNRIEYLDALRGFVMLLVVLGHVPMYCYHHLAGVSFSAIPSTFHLALFFFISGWFVNSKAVRNADATLRLRYDNDTFNGLWKVLKGKFVQLIVPTVVFYLLHFFFLPGNLEWLGRYVMGNGNPTVELFVSLAIAIMVVSLCLLMSNIIRLSPLLAHWGLGSRTIR